MNPLRLVAVIALLVAAAGIAGSGLLQLQPTPDAIPLADPEFSARVLPSTVPFTTTDDGSIIVLDIHAWASLPRTATLRGALTCQGEPVLNVGLETLQLTGNAAWFWVRLQGTSVTKGTTCSLYLEAVDAGPSISWDAFVLWGHPASSPGEPGTSDVTPATSPSTTSQTAGTTEPVAPAAPVDLLGMLAIGLVVLLVLGAVALLVITVLEG